MKKIKLPIKGLHYYDAEYCLKNQLLYSEQTLILKLEPDNQFDKYAVQLWISNINKTKYLLGYIPRTHSRWVSYLKNNNSNPVVKISSIAINLNLLKIDITLYYEYKWWNFIHYKLCLFKVNIQLKNTKC